MRYIFEVGTNLEQLGDVTESMFYERLGELGAMSVNDAPDKGLNLLSLLCSYGAEQLGTNGFILTDVVKKKYFSSRFQKFKELSSELELEEFATDALYTLRNTIEESYGDMVYSDELLSSLDSWIREAQVGTPYYVGTAIAMN